MQVPIISTVAVGYNCAVYNINADLAAARIAAEMKAAKLILMTDIKGLLKDKDDESRRELFCSKTNQKTKKEKEQ